MRKNKEMKHHIETCDCEICKNGLEAVREKEQKMIERYGHSIRYIFDSYQTEYGVFPSIFTRGLTETANHSNLEVVLPVDQATANFLLNTLAEKIHQGWEFKLNQVYQIPELNNVPFYFELSVQPEIKEHLYRVIIADPQLKLPGEDGCDFMYQMQSVVGNIGNEKMAIH